jgi:glycosyltransferase involved in cell wall biosynthesis
MERYMNKPEVSIIIPCFNQARYLPEAIESALDQTVKCEVIVVNDGSIDSTYREVMKYPVISINQPNKGLSGARNTGVRMASGQRILVLDADDKIHSRLVELSLDFPNTYMIRYGMQEFGQSSRYIKPWQENTVKDFIPHNRAFCCTMFPKEAWNQVQGYDESMIHGYEDWDFWVRCLHAGYTFKNIDEALFFYRKHGYSAVSHAQSKHMEIYAYMTTKWRNLGIL